MLRIGSERGARGTDAANVRELTRPRTAQCDRNQIAPLSEQEHRVLRNFSEGQSPANIVRALKISPQTLRNHLHHINQKLGTHTRLEAVIHAIRRKLI